MWDIDPIPIGGVNEPMMTLQSKATFAESAPKTEVGYRREAAEHPTVSVVGTVGVPIDLAWKVFKPFGPPIMTWWPIYKWVKLEPEGVDEVGAVRHFKANGATYRERLICRDD